MDSAGGKFCDEASLGDAVLSDFMRVTQGTKPKLLALGEVSTTKKELKPAFKVSGITGPFCDGQEGKLAEVLG